MTPSQHTSKAVRDGKYTRPLLNPISAQLGARFARAENNAHLQRYQYKEIRGHRHIRLMILKPATLFSAPLHCEIVEVVLDARPFEALSYVWGSTADLQPLLCHGQMLEITQNLDGALRFLRRRMRKRAVWVDAVCINQDDPTEKETQIPLMRDLYTVATHSLIWLGAPDPEALAVFYTLRIVYSGVLFAAAYSRFMMRIHGQHALEDKVLLRRRMNSDHEGNRFLRDLLERDWFTRTWTIQELLLNKTALVMCGRHTIPARKLAAYVHQMLPWFVHNSSQREQHYHRVQGHILLGYVRNDGFIKEQLDAIQLMMVVRSASTSDAKDKVIGIQAILQRIGIVLPSCSYAMTVSELYTTLVTAWIKHWGDLQIVSLAGSTSITEGLASRVPDWNNLEQADGKIVTDHYTRLVYSQCIDSVTKRNISATRKHALQVDIQSNGKLVVSGYNPGIAVQNFVQCFEAVRRSNPWHEHEQNSTRRPCKSLAAEARVVISWATFVLDAFSNKDLAEGLQCLAAIMNVGPRTLITLKYQQHGLQEHLQEIAALSTLHAVADDILEERLRETTVLQSPLWLALTFRSNTETLFLTNDSRLGLVYSSSISTGDSVVLVAGSDMPLLLRAHPAGRAHQYSFVGSAILSDVPGAQRRVLRRRWEDRPSGQKWTEYLFKPTLPGDVTGKGSMWHYAVNDGNAVVSGLMRGETWQEEVDVDDLELMTLV